MRSIGCDLHRSQQTLAMLDRDTGEEVRKTRPHDGDAVRDVYASLVAPGVVGIAATGSMGWFLQLMETLGITCHVGHPAAIRKADTRRQKHDRRDADWLLKLLVDGRCPTIWIPSTEGRDLRAWLLHGHQWVRMRTRVPNARQAIALSHGVRRGPALWTRDGHAAMTASTLPPQTDARRTALLAWYASLHDQVEQLDARGRAVAAERHSASLLMTHPGVGPVTALATEVCLGDPTWFRDGKALASDVGLIPSDYSSGSRQRLGSLSKQGNPFLRVRWCDATLHAARLDPALHRVYRRSWCRRAWPKRAWQPRAR